MKQGTATNPFRPSFGSSPPFLAGRDDLLTSFRQALDAGPGTPGYMTIITGARGVGKTVGLNALEEEVVKRRWAVIQETGSPGLSDRLVGEHLPALLRQHDPKAVRRRLSSLSVSTPVGGGTVGWETLEQYVVKAGLRVQLFVLADLLAAEGRGLFVSVDEMHMHAGADLRRLAEVLQHCVRQDRPVVFAGAGLPSALDEIFEAPGLTFFRRSHKAPIGAIDRPAVEAALRDPIVEGGRSIEANALAAAIEATRGYPYLVQLVGYHVWAVRPLAQRITVADVSSGVPLALDALGPTVLQPILRDLSPRDRGFLVAMTEDDGPSLVSDIGVRTGQSRGNVQTYRARLLQEQVIVPAGRGYVDFAIPYLRQYLRDHPEHDVDARTVPATWSS